MSNFDKLFIKYVIEGSSKKNDLSSIEEKKFGGFNKKFRDNMAEFLKESIRIKPYKIPEDKSQMMADFYIIDALKGQVKYVGQIPPNWKKTQNPHIYKETRNEYIRAVEIIKTEMKAELLEAVFFALASEFRHIFDHTFLTEEEELVKYVEKNFKNGKEFLKKYISNYGDPYSSDKSPWQRRFRDDGEADEKYKDDDTERLKSYKALIQTKIPRHEIVEIMDGIFNDLEWKEAFGGKAWGDISSGWLKLHKADSEKEIFMAIDNIYDLQHNTSTVFNKLKSYYKKTEDSYDPYSWVLDALNRKFGAKSPWELWKFASPTMKPIAAEMFRALGYGTKEDYDNYVKKELQLKNSEEFDKLKTDYMKSQAHPPHPDHPKKLKPKQDWESIYKSIKEVYNDIENMDLDNASYDKISKMYNKLNDGDIKTFVPFMPPYIRKQFDKYLTDLFYRKREKLKELKGKA